MNKKTKERVRWQYGERSFKDDQTGGSQFKTLLPIALLLPCLILVKVGIRVALRIPHMALWALRGLLSLLRLLSASASARAESVAPIETTLGVRLLNTASRLGLAMSLANANACRAVLHANALRVGFVCRLGRRTTPALGERRARRGRVTLTETHETLDSLSTVQLWVLAVLARSEVVHSLCVIVLWSMVLISEIIVGRGWELVLLIVEPTTIMVRLRLHRAGTLLASRRGCSTLGRRARLEHGGILDELLRNTVA